MKSNKIAKNEVSLDLCFTIYQTYITIKHGYTKNFQVSAADIVPLSVFYQKWILYVGTNLTYDAAQRRSDEEMKDLGQWVCLFIVES